MEKANSCRNGSQEQVAGLSANHLDEEIADDENTLDLTGFQLHNLDNVSIAPTLEEVDLTANRLSQIDPALGKLPRLKKLIFRQNLLQDQAAAELAKFSALSSLEELVLRDNKLETVPPLSVCPGLLVLDLSWNCIRSMDGLAAAPLPLLRELHLSANFLGPHIQKDELAHLSCLELLELGSNKIRTLDGIEPLTSLRELWLGRNKIRSVEAHLTPLTSLVKLSLQSNRLTSTCGFQECILLEELYLSHNGIERMEGLSGLACLRILDVSSNFIAHIEGVHTLARLEDFWCNNNRISTLDHIAQAFAGSIASLTTIYLEGNPCASDPAAYMAKLRAALPSLQQIDAHELK